MTAFRPDVRVRWARSATALVLATLALTACGGSGSQTQCGLDGCTITFARSGAGTEVSVLGITAKLVGVENGAATIAVAGNTVTVPVGAQTAAEGFTVGVERLTDTEVVVRVRPGTGG